MYRLWPYLRFVFLILLASCLPIETHTPNIPAISSIAPTSTMILSTSTSLPPPITTPTVPSSSTPHPVVPSDIGNQLIAYSSDQDGDFEIWLMNADGSNQLKLTENHAMDISPAWSPDGSRIAFISNRDGNDEIYVMNADGRGTHRLTNTDARESFPAWSPDGKLISFDSDRGGNWDIFVMESDGSNPRRLTDHPSDDWISSWSPDSSKIVFESKRDGDYEIYVMNANGNAQQQLTDNQTHDGFPAWSADGTQIAIMSRRDGNNEIYVMNADGTSQQRLTNNPMEDTDPAWSPDGKWLAFVSNRDGNDEIYIMKSVGGDIHQLTDNGVRNWSPTWQPSILEIDSPASWSGPYFGQEPPGMEPELFAPEIISSPDFSEYSGAFSPDGDEYYFYRYSPTSESVLLFSKVVDGKWSVPEQLAVTSEYVAFEPYVSMDNQRLYFAWGYPVSEGQPQFPYFFVERKENGWSEPIYAGQGMFLSSTQDGQLYTTDMSSRNADGKTYLAKISVTDGVFTDYERLLIETPWGNPAHPCIAPDGSYILYDVESGNHLFVSFRKVDGTWGEPIDLTEHGFDPMAGGAYISPDGKYLFFSFNKDIWWVDIKVIEDLRPSE